MNIWRLKGRRGNTDKGVCPVTKKEGVTSCKVKEKGTGGADG
jgi:hypothetical protein